MIRLISFNICPYVQRVAAALEAKEISYNIQYIDLHKKPQWFLDISPTGQVPILITESGTPLFESDAIIEYIEDAYGAIEPELNPVQKALDRAWSYQASKLYIVLAKTLRSSDETTFLERLSELEKAFTRIEQQLEKEPYFKGAKISKVDIAWLPILHRTAIANRYTGFNFYTHFPKMKQWQDALLATGIPEKSVSSDFKDAFIDFYLSDCTYLGSKISRNGPIKNVQET